MGRRACIGIVLACALLTWPVASQDPAPPAETPVDIGQVEDVQIRLILLDVVVFDAEGRTVPELRAEDFEVQAGGDLVEVDTLDTVCPGGAAPEPRGVRDPSRRDTEPAPGRRRLVLAFDYLHLDPGQRVDSLEQAQRMVGVGGAEEELMVVALNGGLRIEQPFTRDREEVRRALQRMEYDISLWRPDFYHATERRFVEPLTALLDVLGNVAGPKSIVLYSAMDNAPLDLQFRQISGVAAASRCSIYPVDARGLAAPLPFGEDVTGEPPAACG